MRHPLPALVIGFLLMGSVSCSVIPPAIKRQALPEREYGTLLAAGERLAGETVILGGSIIGLRHNNTGTILTILQAPLMTGDEPMPKDYSEGRFFVRHPDVLDPEVYKTGRKITVAGRIVGLANRDMEQCLATCLVVDSLDLYLWPEYPRMPPVPYWCPYYYYDGYGDDFDDPIPFWRRRCQPYPYFRP